ncbi:MAG: hypothetical protein H0W73_03435 [Bacteroidetes bacterium]|nr:hypothetical protein [Bacteroidota bacterium]
MGYKKVCFTCRKAFSVYKNATEKINRSCPECGKQTIIFSHLFKPPKQTDIKKWKVVEFLKDHGFVYQRVYATYTDSILSGQSGYPETMAEAKKFIIDYKDQARLLIWDNDKKEFMKVG